MEQDRFFEQFIDDYYAECDEHVAAIRRALLALEEQAVSPGAEASPTLLQDLRRGLHTLKGLSGMVGLTSAEQTAHALEDALRSAGPTADGLDRRLIDTLFDGIRVFEACVNSRRSGGEPPSLEPLLRDVAAFTDAAEEAEHADGRAATVAVALTDTATPTSPAVAVTPREIYRFEFAPSPETAARGITVEVVRQRLASLGELLDARPRVTAGAGIVFEFRVAVTVGAVPDESWHADRLSWTLEAAADEHVPVEADSDGAEVAGGVPRPASRVPPSSVVRVDLARLEDLMRVVGDLVVSRSRLGESLRRNKGAADENVWDELHETSAAMERQLRILREGVMRIRLVRLGEVFERLRYAIRDVARDSGKEVALTIEGQDTEIDKAVVDRMLEPMMHLVRNAVSHGIEPADVRRGRGKDPVGHIALRAAASGDRILIQVEDDGAGIDAEGVYARQATSDKRQAGGTDLLDVICAPGFSTREEADLASGRGIGMAVVRSTVRQLGGDIALHTVAGHGTRFTIELPLTLMIVDALIVDIGDQQMAVPQPVLREIVQFDAGDVTVVEHNEIVSHRDRVLPLLFLRKLFGMESVRAPVLNVLVVGSEAQPVGLVVDRIKGLREIVVHPVTDPLIAVPGVGGATELGDGRVSLILDASALVRLAHARTRRRAEPSAALATLAPANA